MDSGFISLKKIELDYFGNKEDLTTFVVDINIYESIFDPYISATLSIVDGAGLLDRITWAGSTITLSYTSSTEIDPVTMKFVVDGVVGATPNNMDKNQSYIVKLYSEEVKRSLTVRVGEMFTKQAPEKMIESIIRNKIKSTKRISVAKTGALDSINCANLRPYQAIDKIKRRAVSRDKMSSSFVFFENQYGFNFKPIEQMLAELRNDPQIKNGDRNFYYDAVKHATVVDSSWRQVLALEKTIVQSLTDTLYEGGLANKIYAYNINTGDHYAFDYYDKSDGNKFDVNEKSITYKRIAVDEIVKTGDDIPFTVQPITSTDDLERIKKEIYLNAFTSKLAANILRVQIYGDSRLTVGTGINLNIPVLDGMTTKNNNQLQGGVYLISKLRHMIDPSQGQYRQACELMRTGMLE